MQQTHPQLEKTKKNLICKRGEMSTCRHPGSSPTCCSALEKKDTAAYAHKWRDIRPPPPVHLSLRQHLSSSLCCSAAPIFLKSSDGRPSGSLGTGAAGGDLKRRRWTDSAVGPVWVNININIIKSPKHEQNLKQMEIERPPPPVATYSETLLDVSNTSSGDVVVMIPGRGNVFWILLNPRMFICFPACQERNPLWIQTVCDRAQSSAPFCLQLLLQSWTAEQWRKPESLGFGKHTCCMMWWKQRLWSNKNTSVVFACIGAPALISSNSSTTSVSISPFTESGAVTCDWRRFPPETETTVPHAEREPPPPPLNEHLKPLSVFQYKCVPHCLCGSARTARTRK